MSLAQEFVNIKLSRYLKSGRSKKPLEEFNEHFTCHMIIIYLVLITEWPAHEKQLLNFLESTVYVKRINI